MATPSSRGAEPCRSGRASRTTGRPRAAATKPVEAPNSAPSSRSTLSPWRSVLGPESRLPNVHWQAMSPSTLRRMPYFTALPPPEHVEVGGEVSYRYVRQDSELWGALHGGRLTTARLKDALGLRDATAARLGVGGPQFAEAGVARAYKHLTTTSPPLAVQPPATSPAAAAAAAGQRRVGGHEELLSRNELARLSYNQQLGNPGDAGVAEEAGWSEQDRRRISELAALTVGAAGAARMRLLWGTLQESAAVATLSLLFPGSQLEEVGLVALEDPTPWGVERGELPPMGASPDALMTHRVPITHADIQDAAQQLRAAAGAAAPPSPSALRAAASGVLRAALERHTQQQLQQSGLLRMPSDSGSSNSSSSGGTACVPAVSASAAGPAPSGPALPATGLPLHASGEAQALSWIEGKLREAVCVGGGGGAATAQVGASNGGHGVDGGSGGGDGVAGVVVVREAVEVKNSCPFVYKGQRKARKRGVNIHYVVSDRGPHGGLWPLWVPQLQAHMAAAGTGSALLLSRSASRGVRLFRVYRDDAYLVSALGLVRELQHAHVARGTPPGADPWATRPGYGDFVRHTVEVARGAAVVLETGVTPQVPGCLPGGAFWAMR